MGNPSNNPRSVNYEKQDDHATWVRLDRERAEPYIAHENCQRRTLQLQQQKLELEIRLLRGPSSGRNAHEYARDAAMAFAVKR
jgi:hypothetical protein